MTFQNRGLLLPGTRVEVQLVKPAHRKLCDLCKKIPAIRRLQVREGSARSAVTWTFCVSCGSDWLGSHRQEVDRATELLMFGSLDETHGNAVRLDSDIRQRMKERSRERRDSRKKP